MVMESFISLGGTIIVLTLRKDTAQKECAVILSERAIKNEPKEMYSIVRKGIDLSSIGHTGCSSSPQ